MRTKRVKQIGVAKGASEVVIARFNAQYYSRDRVSSYPSMATLWFASRAMRRLWFIKSPQHKCERAFYLLMDRCHPFFPGWLFKRILLRQRTLSTMAQGVQCQPFAFKTSRSFQHGFELEIALIANH